MIRRLTHYEVLDKIGAGGMATVYRGRDLQTGTIVALKVMHPHLAEKADYVMRFRREASTVLGLDSENIVKVLDYGEDQGLYFIVMELVVGRTLQQTMGESSNPLDVPLAIDICMQVCRALECAAKRFIVHRDIKPQNIMLSTGSDGKITAKVMDFGIARMLGFSAMTQTGAFIGSPHYMSPEQARGKDVDKRSDLYSLGITLYQMLTGKVPFDGETPWAIIEQQIRRDPAPPSSLRHDLPPALDEFIHKALAKDPEKRFQTPSEMEQALLRIQGSGQVPAKRALRLLAVAGVAGVAFVVLVSAALSASQNSPAPAPTATSVSATPVLSALVTNTAVTLVGATVPATASAALPTSTIASTAAPAPSPTASSTAAPTLSPTAVVPATATSTALPANTPSNTPAKATATPPTVTIGPISLVSHGPGNNDVFTQKDDTVEFSWEPVPNLSPGAIYEVVVRWQKGWAANERRITVQQPIWNMPKDYRNQSDGGRYEWSVRVRSADGSYLNQASETRFFFWREEQTVAPPTVPPAPTTVPIKWPTRTPVPGL